MTEAARALQALRPRDIPRICERCREPFTGYANQRFCSDQCRSSATTATYRARMRTKQP